MAEKLSDEAIANELQGLGGWEHREDHLVSSFRFAGFSEAVGFMMRVALVCEKLDHHPNWYNVYDKVDVRLSTHDQGGITKLDVELARAMNAIAGRAAAS